MTRNESKKNINKKKFCLFSIMTVLTLILIVGIKSAYAYYSDKDTFNIVSALVGNFDVANGDVNVLIYKEDDEGNYTKTYSIPELGYIFDPELDLNKNNNCSIPCSYNDPTASCHYTFNSEASTKEKAFQLTTDEKVTCKFYFKKETEADVKVLIMIEDKNGTESFGENKYTLVEDIPSYGYEYSENYVCNPNVESLEYINSDESTGVLEYDAPIRKFKVATRTKTVCKAYFDSIGNPDTKVRVHVQSAKGSTVYNEVTSIPTNQKFKISENPDFISACYRDDNSVATSVKPTYDENGYINVDNIDVRQTCDIYLDIVE